MTTTLGINMKYFLLVYDRREGRLLSDEEFAEDSREDALARRFRLERDYRSDDNIEVVLLGSESREVVERTHARYFKDISQLVSEAEVNAS